MKTRLHSQCISSSRSMAAVRLPRTTKFTAIFWKRSTYVCRKSEWILPNKIASNKKAMMWNDVVIKRPFFQSARAAVSYYYDIMLHTGNRFGAGTDANVYMKLHGEKGASDEIKLPAKKGDLERGMVNRYKIAAADLGILKQVNVRHDNTGLAPAWFLEKVTIKDHSGSRYMFNCGEWLLKRGNNDKLVANLSLTEQNIDQLSSFKGKSLEYMKLDEQEHLDAVEESIHENLTSVLEGIINSDKDTKSEEQFEDIPVIDSTKSNGESISTNAPMLPAARLLVEAFGLIKGTIPATGPKGHILKGDVLRFIDANKLTKPEIKYQKEETDSHAVKVKATAATATKQIKKSREATKGIQRTTSTSDLGYEDVMVNESKKNIASQFLESKKTIPHVYLMKECNMDNVINLCRTYAEQGKQISRTAFITKASSMALNRVPEINFYRNADDANSSHNSDVTVLLANGKKMLTGVVQDVDQKRLNDIESLLQEMKLANPRDEDSRMALFTVADLSTGGLVQFSEIIVPPQVCVLSIGQPKPTISENDTLANVVKITLSCNGARIDEETGSKFLNLFVQFLENPSCYFE